MKSKFIIVLILFCCLNAFSQDNGFLGLELGVSVPNGAYASKNSEISGSGYATTGFHLGISGTYLFSENWGIAYSWRTQQNGIDAQTIADQAASELNDFDITVNAGTYSLNGFMIGGFVTLPLREKIHWDSKVLMGFMTAKKPFVTITANDGINVIESQQMEENSISFSLGIYSGLRFDINNKMAFTAGLESVFANPTFDNVETVGIANGVVFDTSTDKITQSINNLNISLGIAYRFN